MSDKIESFLCQTFDEVRTETCLHDVPPHEVHEVIVDDTRAILKFDTGPTGRAGIEGAVMALLDERTSVPVPTILATDEDYYVARWHPDAPAPDTDPTASETWAGATGACLAQLHTETEGLIDQYGQFVPDDDRLIVDGHDRWQSAMIAYITDRRPVLARFGHEDMADAAIATLEAQTIDESSIGPPVCCHGWATPEHVSVVDGSVACLIDFEHTLAAPPAYDLWRTVIPAFAATGRQAEQEAFFEGYQAVRSLPDDFRDARPVFDILNLVYYFESLYVQEQYDRQGTERRADGLRSALTDTLEALSESKQD